MRRPIVLFSTSLDFLQFAFPAQLYEVMNPSKDRYFKMNLQNIASGRQPTIEFRQHSGTLEYEKIASWIRCGAPEQLGLRSLP